MTLELEGEWAGFEAVLEGAEPAPVIIEEPPPARTYEQHLVLEDWI